MALIPCKECGAKVSSTAPSCPHCGAKIAGKSNSQIQGLDAVFLLASCIVGLFLGLFLSALPGEDGNPQLRVALGILGVGTPPTATLIWSNRRQQ